MFIRDIIYTFETNDKIVKYSSNLYNQRTSYPFAFGEKNIYFLTSRYEFIPYDTIQDENIKNMDLKYDCYDFLYNTNEGNRYQILNLNLIALRSHYDNINNNENFFDIIDNIEDENEDENEDEEDKINSFQW